MTSLRGLKIENLEKYYGNVQAVKGIDLHVAEGEFAVLVGPSGCGKSTLLRAIAGLESVSSGSISLNGREIGNLQPKDRNIAMVFQSYALYPYLTVFDNIAFGLRARKAPETEITERVRGVANTLHLDAVLERFPRELSGGQRQRVAIGRAIVREAELYLFDEPLSNLDAKLRDGMREELKRLHQKIGKTFVYVTHDQIEAMTLADRIVLLNDGRIEQQGAPLELFEKPANRFVAAFLGSPTMNMLPVRLTPDRQHLVLTDDERLLPLGGTHVETNLQADKDYLLGIRPEHFRTGGADNSVSVKIEIVQPTGSRSLASFKIGNTPLIAELDAHATTRSGEMLELTIAMEHTVILDRSSGHAISYGNGAR